MKTERFGNDFGSDLRVAAKYPEWRCFPLSHSEGNPLIPSALPLLYGRQPCQMRGGSPDTTVLKRVVFVEGIFHNFVPPYHMAVPSAIHWNNFSNAVAGDPMGPGEYKTFMLVQSYMTVMDINARLT